jgi:hypothetical protein
MVRTLAERRDAGGPRRGQQTPMRQGCVRVSYARVRVPSRNAPPNALTASLNPLPLPAPIRKEAVVLNAMHDRSTGFEPRRERVSATDPRLPDSFVGMVAFGATLAVGVALARAGTAVGWGTQLAAMAVAVALLSWWCRVLPSLFVAMIGWLMLNGIVVNGAGRLGWDAHEDPIRVGVLLGAGLAVALTRTLALRLRPLSTGSPALEADRHLYVVQSDNERRGDRHA